MSVTWLVGGLVLLALLMLVWVPWQVERTWRAGLELAKRRRWELVHPAEIPAWSVRFGGTINVSGRERGRRVRWRAWNEPKGRSRQAFTRWELELDGVGSSLRIVEESFLTRLAERFGYEDRKTGDEAFDRRFRVLNTTSELARAFFPEWRQQLMATWPTGLPKPELVCDGRSLCFTVSNGASPGLLRKMEPMLPVLLDLAEFLEAYGASLSRVQPPSSPRR